jgi:hypothetical protein
MVPQRLKARRKTMTNTSKLALVAAIVAFSIATPALAQLRDRSVDSFRMVPPNSAIAPQYNPELTGGGSAGYNQNLVEGRW